MRDRLSEGHPDSPLLLYIGRLSAEKDLESLRPMLDAFPSARLALVGDGPHRLELEEYFAGMNVFMAGFLHGEELAAAYASADIFIMPSQTETLGLVVLAGAFIYVRFKDFFNTDTKPKETEDEKKI